jgi:hypothetical protein
VERVTGRVKLTLQPENPAVWGGRPRKASVVVAWQRSPGYRAFDDGAWPGGPTRAVLTDGQPLIVDGAQSFAIAFADSFATTERDSVTISFEAAAEPPPRMAPRPEPTPRVETTPRAEPTRIAEPAAIAAPMPHLGPTMREKTTAAEELRKTSDAYGRQLASNAEFNQAKKLFMDKQFPAAKAMLEKCIRTNPAQADCHKLLGTVWAKLNDPYRGAREYREFLRLAPRDHPDREKVKLILETFDEPK